MTAYTAPNSVAKSGDKDRILIITSLGHLALLSAARFGAVVACLTPRLREAEAFGESECCLLDKPERLAKPAGNSCLEWAERFGASGERSGLLMPPDRFVVQKVAGAVGDGRPARDSV
ncbi:hypothetical protein MMC18_001204 [Xylographa bjoerkii]|nr:hypothetical protein [Xylographa bjoerkii]